MATKKKTEQPEKEKVFLESAAENKSITVQHIQLQTMDTATKDIKDFKDARDTAIDEYYPNRAALYDIYYLLEQDPHFSGIWKKHIASIRNKKMCYYTPDGEKVEEMEPLLKTKEWRSFIKLIMESESHGISGVEFIPGSKFYFTEINRKHIHTRKRVIIKQQHDNDGIDYEKQWNILVIGQKLNIGFLAKLAPYILWKQGNFGDWAQFCEIYGHPTELWTYDVHDIQTKRAASDAMKAAGGSRRLLIPKQLEFDMKDGKQASADGGLYQKLYDACNSEISKCVLGNTETTESSSSSGYAQASVHESQQEEIMLDDMELVKMVLNDEKFKAILKSYLLPVVDGGYFEYEAEPDLDKQAKQMSIVKQVEQMVPVDDDFIYETFHIPKPDNYDELKAQQEEERAARQALSPAGGGENKPPAKKGDGGGKKTKNQKQPDNLTLWEKFMATLADFFGPGHKG